MMDAGSVRLNLRIDGMHCKRCVGRVEAALDSIDHVSDVQLDDWQSGRALVIADESIDRHDIQESIKQAGYELSEVTIAKHEHPDHPVRSNNQENPVYDLAIMGGGSAAFAAALRASELGARSVIINGGLPTGGTCVNVGCVPSKSFVRTAEAIHDANRNAFDGVESSATVANYKKLTASTQAIVDDLRARKYEDLISDDPNIDLVRGWGRLVSHSKIQVDDRVIEARRVIIATGARTFIPDIPGLSDIEYLTHETLYTQNNQADHLLILGGGYVALESAQAFRRLGSKVTILQRSSRVLTSQSDDIARAIQKFLSDEGVTIATDANVHRVSSENNRITVVYSRDGKEEVATGSHLLVATGTRGNTSRSGAADLDLEIGVRDHLVTDDYLATSDGQIYAAGDVRGENQYVYAAAYEGKIAAENALTNNRIKVDYSALPWVVFTDPQIAGVGLDESEAASAGIPHESATLDLKHLARAITGRDTRGFIRLIRNPETDSLIGARVVASSGSEILMEAVMAIKFGITVSDLAGMFHPYLTLSEGMKLAALAFTKDVDKLSCCAT